ncbi:MAG: S8 family serine peptidase [Muribaculaceae bacterium]|nr:S8 family serine peptidase [Muribaculaceae bacterium]
MKTFYTFAAMLLVAACAFAQARVAPVARFLVHQAEHAQSRTDVERPVLAFVDLDKDTSYSNLASTPGVEIVSVRGSIALVRFPIGKTDDIAAMPGIKSISFGYEAKPLMDEARKVSYVDQVQQGTDLPEGKNYRGRGVILGMMDTGLDANHINFYDTQQQANRITWCATIYGTEGSMTEYDSPAKILAFSTDNPRSTHGTHVAGIMSGAFNKKGSVATTEGKKDKNVPFYGVAPSAELNLCAGDLYETNITLAAEAVLNRAKAAGKPAVFNLSVGSVAGPHDGTDAYNRYMNELGKEMVICIAAGNDGTEPISLQADFAATPEVKTALGKSGESWSGLVDVWNSTATPFDVTLAFVNSSTGDVAWSVAIPTDMGDGKVFLLSNSADNTSGATHNTVFDKGFSSSSNVYAATAVDGDNNRYNAQIQFSLTPAQGSALVPVLIFKGTAGSLDAYSQSSSGLVFTNTIGGGEAAGYTAGNASQSINNLAMAENIICVGSYTDRIKWPTLSGEIYAYSNYSEDAVGQVSDFTSYGDGPTRHLPDFCAPGMGIISSFSQYYVNTLNVEDKGLSAKVTTSQNVSTGSRSNPWGIEQGTSMATPYVAGAVAMMLEANPALGVADIRSILSSTCMQRTGRTEAEQLQWGAGAVNVLDAVRKVLGLTSGVADIRGDAGSRLAVEVFSGSVVAKVAGASAVTARLFSSSGALAASAQGGAGQVSLSTAGLQKGVYVLAVDADGASASKSVVIE